MAKTVYQTDNCIADEVHKDAEKNESNILQYGPNKLVQ